MAYLILVCSDNQLVKCAVIKYKMCSDKAVMNLEDGVNNSQPLCKLCIIFRIPYRMFPQITGNTILEILDYKIFCGCMSRNPPPPQSFVMPVPTLNCQDENQFILCGHVIMKL